MTLKTSLLNSGIFKYNIKRFWWISAIYAFLLFLVAPYRILCDRKYLLDRLARFPDKIPGITLLQDASMFIFLIGAAILLGICVFRYLQKTRSATLFHALPVNRTQLYITTLASGFALLMAPILLNAIILCLMSLFGGFDKILPLYIIGDWVLGQLITGTSTLCFTIFVGVFTGSSVAQVIFVFILSFLPLGILTVASDVLDGWLFGFTSSGMNPIYENMLRAVPMYYPQFFNSDFVWWIPVLNGIYIILFSGLGLFFYHKRNIESAGDIVAFSWVKPIFLYGVTFCMMLFGPVFFSGISGYYTTPNVFFFLFFALLGYAVAKILLLKSFRIIKYYKGYVACAVVILLAFFVIDGNLIGFGTKVPEASGVVRAYVGDYYNYNAMDQENVDGDVGYAILTDRGEIDMVLALHRDMVEEGIQTFDIGMTGKRQIFIAYELESGRKFVRKYWGTEEQLFAIFNTEGAKDYMFPNFRKYPDRIRYITILPHQNREEATLYEAKKEELIACVQKDLAKLSYEEIGDRYGYYKRTVAASGESVTVMPADDVKKYNSYSMEIGIATDDGSPLEVWFSFNDNFAETLSWLANNGFDLQSK